MQPLRVLNLLECFSWKPNCSDSYILPLVSVNSRMVSQTGKDWVPNSLLNPPSEVQQASKGEAPAQTPQQWISPPCANPELPTPLDGEDQMQGREGDSMFKISGMSWPKSFWQLQRYLGCPQPQDCMPCRIQLLPDHKTTAGQLRNLRTWYTTSSLTFQRNWSVPGQTESLNMKSWKIMMPLREAISQNQSLSYCPPPHTRIMLKLDSTASFSRFSMVLGGWKSLLMSLGYIISMGTQLAPLQQMGQPLRMTWKSSPSELSFTVRMPQTIRLTSRTSLFLNSLASNSQRQGSPMLLGHQSRGYLMVSLKRLYLDLRWSLKWVSVLKLVSSTERDLSVSPQFAFTPCRAKVKSRMALSWVSQWLRTQMQSNLAYSQQMRWTGSHIPMVFMQGAQSHEYWQQALRVCAQSKGMRSLFCLSASTGFELLSSTTSKLLPSFTCGLISYSYLRKALTVSPSLTSLTQMVEQVSMPWKRRAMQGQQKMSSLMAMVLMNLAEQSEMAARALKFQPKQGFGIWLYFCRFRCRVEGTLTSNSFPIRLLGWLPHEVTTIFQPSLSSTVWKWMPLPQQASSTTSISFTTLIRIYYIQLMHHPYN